MKPKKVMCQNCEASEIYNDGPSQPIAFQCHRRAPMAETVDGGYFPLHSQNSAWCMEGIEKEKEGENENR